MAFLGLDKVELYRFELLPVFIEEISGHAIV